MDAKPIREIIQEVQAGQIRIPAFQRGFVWEPERVAQLMDSIYKKYPFGVLLFWRTKEKIRSERKLGPFELPKPKDEYPIDYVLDGQQRITSIFAVFQTDFPVPENSDWEWRDIYFDVEAAVNPQDAQFFALTPSEVDAKRHFPLKSLFDPIRYRTATEAFASRTDLILRLDNMQATFKEIQIPVQVIRTDDKSMVAIIFERINRQGVPLDTLQLLSAWTWSEEFHLQNQFEELATELEAYGFNQQDSEVDLLLRCTAAILVKDPSPEALVSLNGSLVRKRFDEVVNGIKGALDFLKNNFKVERLSNLPFQTILVPLAVFHAVAGGKSVSLSQFQTQKIRCWFWRLCLSRRYSSGTLRNLKEDIDQMIQLRDTGESALGDWEVLLDAAFFIDNKFGMSNVNTKTFILMLAQAAPLNFVSGSSIDLAAKLKDYNRAEFHHLYPKSYLTTAGLLTVLYPDANCLANFTFIASIDNKKLSGSPPSIYRALMPKDVGEILKHSLCPHNLFDDRFNEFIGYRASILAEFGNELIDNGTVDVEKFIEYSPEGTLLVTTKGNLLITDEKGSVDDALRTILNP